MSYVSYDDEVFVISINGRKLSILRKNISPVHRDVDAKQKEIAGFLGLFVIEGEYYIATYGKIEKIIDYMGIHKISDLNVYRVSEGENSEKMKLLSKALELSPLYFSSEGDMSNSILRSQKSKDASEYFTWNYNAVHNHGVKYSTVMNFISETATRVIAGYVGAFTSGDLTYVLISRRCCKRAGTRFWVRGSDGHGNVANFVETEQIILFNNNIYSFVQIRGSIPFQWCQTPCLKRTPPIELPDKSQCLSDLKKHTDIIKELYIGESETCIFINLTKKKGTEGAITSMFTECTSDLASFPTNFSYLHFDFAEECKNMNYNNIAKLMKRVFKIGRINEGNTFFTKDKELQSVFIRTNCIDCLDRTNIVQSNIAREIFQLINEDEYKKAERTFRNIWADNADALSTQYSGTPALKTDFTRTGRRTVFGAVADGRNAISRYITNVLRDGVRQDAYDCVTQTSCVKEPTKNQARHVHQIPVFMIIPIIILALIVSLLIYPFNRKLSKKLRSSMLNKPLYRPIPRIKR